MREKIIEDLKVAMKNQDKDRLAVIRMVKGAISLEEINTKKELKDDEVISIIAKQIKTRKESLEDFKKANREDLIEKTNFEIKILEEYMPEQMSEEEIIKEINKIFDIVKPTSQKDMGALMKEAYSLKGKADMSLVSRIIKEKLADL